MSRTKNRLTWKLIPLIILAVIVVVYLGLSIYFQRHFSFRTTINSVSVSGSSIGGAEEKLAQEMKNYEFIMEERGEKQETISGEAIAIEPLFENEMEELLSRQNGFAWPYYLIKGQNLEAGTMVGYDEEKLRTELKKLSCMQESSWAASKNASISEYTDGRYTIIEEEYGTEIDLETLVKAAGETITNLHDSLNLSDAGCYVDPTLTKDNKELNAAVDQLNQYVGITITYNVGDDKEKLDGSMINTWLSVNENWEVTIDEELILEYVKTLAKEYNTAYRNRTLDTSYGQTVTVIGGDYGWRIDNSGEADMILADLKEGQDVQRELVYAQTANSHGDHDYGDTYVEINLTAQHLYFYKNGALIVETDFVSGNASKGYDTPVGAYSITYKQRDATLRGQDYESEVSYWMPFNLNVGMHDATWRSTFGGSIYKRKGSHGCVNLPASAAQKIFENIEAGYPVLVYELPGTESAIGKAQDRAYEVDKLISEIGEVTLKSEAAIKKAREAYHALSGTEKGYVNNLSILTAAEATLSQLQTDSENEKAETQAQKDAKAVIKKIKEIGKVTADSKKNITAARSAYDKLSEMAKTYVTNYSTLINAEETYKSLTES